MKISILSMAGVLLAMSLMPGQGICAGSETQNILINEDLQIPGAILAPGKYSLSVEEHLYDRAIVKVARIGQNKRYLVLAVPNAEIKSKSNGELVFFRQNVDETSALKGWDGLEFVYPKSEALKITADSGQTVLAVDPAADKLPANMSRGDMKVVTLWSLSPKQLTSDNRGMGVTTVKYASASDSSATVGVMPAPPIAAVHKTSSSAQHLPKKLPKTASNNYAYLLYGAILLSFAAGFRTLRMRQGLGL